MVRIDWLAIPTYFLGLVLASVIRQDPHHHYHLPFLPREPPTTTSTTTSTPGGSIVTPDQPFYLPLTTLAQGIREAYISRQSGTPSFPPGDFVEDDAVAFASLRAIYGLRERDYVASLTQAPFYSFQTNSKSNQYFCFTGDGQYIIKTMSSEEIAALSDILLDYHRHMDHYRKSLLVQYCGHYRVGSYHFLVMRNLLHVTPGSEYYERYDVKGSTVGRACGEGDLLKSNKVMKDLDLVQRPNGINFGSSKPPFLHQLTADVAFLETHGLMDYSLLLGIKHPKSRLATTSTTALRSLAWLALGPPPRPPPPPSGWEVRSAEGREVYVVGIIDILQLYNYRKKAEVLLKSMVYDYRGVSAAPPTFYANRFLWYLTSVIRGRERDTPPPHSLLWLWKGWGGSGLFPFPSSSSSSSSSSPQEALPPPPA